MPRRQLHARTIGILALPGVQLLDVAGPVDVFAEANVQSGHEAYLTSVLATVAGPVVSSSGLRILPDQVLRPGEAAAFDTLLVAGAPHLGDGSVDPTLLDWLRVHAPRSRPVRVGLHRCNGARSHRIAGWPPDHDPLGGRGAACPAFSGGPARGRCAARPRRAGAHGGGRDCRAGSGAGAGRGGSRARHRQEGRLAARDVLQAAGGPAAIQPAPRRRVPPAARCCRRSSAG